MIDKKRIYDSLERLTKAPSISGTNDENSVTHVIEELLYEIPYFSENKDMVMRLPIEGDPFGRDVIAAFMRLAPQKPDTIILTGHYDVVDVEEFGPLKEAAFDIKKITSKIGELPIDDEARKDLESGDWYFGRGTADMKFGHALSIELMRHFYEEGKLDCNLLYVAVCGEETNSEGMLAAVPFFNRFAKENNLDYKVCLLTECFMVDKEDDGTKYIQYGGAGKVMPMFLCVGKSCHGEEPFLGLDANMLNAEIFKRMHMNPEFCQQNHGVTTAPPAGLKMQDLKVNYSLSSSLYAASYYNIATIKLEPEKLMEMLTDVAFKSFEEVNRILDEKTKAFTAFSKNVPVTYRAEPCVRTFREIFDAAAEKYPGDLNKHMKEYAEELMKENPEMQDTCVKLVKHLYEMQDDKRPMIIVSVIPPYYPDVNIDREDNRTDEMLCAIDRIIKYADDQYGEKLMTSEYYGISDLCYTWLADGMNFDTLFSNLAGSGWFYNFPAEELKEFKVPTLVLGAYGKDLHKYTERLNRHYNFDVLPDLYVKYIEDIASK